LPNTLAHFGVQVLGTRIAVTNPDARLLFLGPVIPDLPWISQRVVMVLFPGINPVDLRLYSSVQASLLFCLVISSAVALVTIRPWLVFGVLGCNSLVHLLLDASEIKWGNGVGLFAPFDWGLINQGFVWPESVFVAILSIAGFIVGVMALGRPGDQIGLRAKGSGPIVAAILLSGYVLAPLAFMEEVERADAYYSHTLRHPTEHIGKPVEFDRVRLDTTSSGTTIRTFAGTSPRVVSSSPIMGGTVSIRGHFIDAATIQVDEIHVHEDLLREIPTYVGLGLLVFAFARGHAGRLRFPGLFGGARRKVN
jgi:hypothetical protein